MGKITDINRQNEIIPKMTVAQYSDLGGLSSDSGDDTSLNNVGMIRRVRMEV